MTSWLDHWLTAFGRSVLDPNQDETTIHRLLDSGSKAVFFLSNQINNVWYNLRLKRRDAVLGAVASDCSPEDLSALRNGAFDDSGCFFSGETVRVVALNTCSHVETVALRKVAFAGATVKRHTSPQSGRRSSGSGPLPKTQKTSGTTSAISSSVFADKGSDQPFPRTPGCTKGKQRPKGKNRGGAS